ncbi:MAG: hypothetical protein ABI051_12465 [Vicinamibacterales bacterium]
MADINHVHPAAPVEEDSISYSGIGWFLAVLVGTTLFCQIFVWGLFRIMEFRADKAEPQRAAMAEPVGSRTLHDGRVVTGAAKAPAVPLLVSEPAVLRAFRMGEDAALHNYGWVDKAAQTVQLPIDRAKELLLERGLPTRPPVSEAQSPAAHAHAAAVHP